MNQQETNISTWLDDPSMLNTAEKTLKSNPEHSHPANNVVVRLDETIELYNYLRELISHSIATGLFSKLPTPSQINIHNNIQALAQNKNNVNQFIVQLQTIYYHVLVAGIDRKLDNFDNYKRALTDIANLRRNYTRSLTGLSDLVKKVNTIERNYDKSVELIESFVDKKEEIERKLKKSEESSNESSAIFEEIQAYQQEVENAKKEIIAFKTNIDSYKEDIEEKSNEAQNIISSFEDQKEAVENLINSAEKALQLKSSVGISAALSTQYTFENKAIKKVSWIIAASVFLTFALGGVLLLLFDFNFEKVKIVNNGINSIVARVVFVGISITGATFCANQYTRQKHIADDYGYKLVLAKSILAFVKEIKRHNPEKAADYIKEVLTEINRSPVQKIKEDGVTEKDVGIIRQIIDLVIKSK